MDIDKNRFPFYQAFALIVLMEIVFFAGDYLALNLRVHGAHIAYHDKVILTMVLHVIILLMYITALVFAAKKRGL